MPTTEKPQNPSPESPDPVVRFRKLYNELIKRWRIIGQDPDRIPIIKKESDLDAWRLELGIRETTTAVCERLEPLIKSLQIPKSPEQTRNTKKTGQKLFSGTRGQFVTRFITVFSPYMSVFVCSTLVGMVIGATIQRPAVIYRVPPQIYLYRKGAEVWVWESYADSVNKDGRWVPTTVIEKTPTQEK